MKTNKMNTIENIEPTVKFLPLQTKTESILARMNADYESKRTEIRNKINLERRSIYALDVLQTQHKSNIQKLQEEENNLRAKWMEEKAKVMEEAEYNRGKDGFYIEYPPVKQNKQRITKECGRLQD